MRILILSKKLIFDFFSILIGKIERKGERTKIIKKEKKARFYHFLRPLHKMHMEIKLHGKKLIYLETILEKIPNHFNFFY